MCNIVFLFEFVFGLIGSWDFGIEFSDELWFIFVKRFGGEEEMVGMILYFVSCVGSYCNGMVFVNDGGWLVVMFGSYWFGC